MEIYSENRKAYFNYQILEKFEAGIVLNGQEVKSIKNGHISLAGSYVVIKDREAYLTGATIPPYQPKNAPADYNPTRSRKLLLKRGEINSLIGKGKQKGLTLLPLKVYNKKGKIKLEFGLVKGSKKSDKRALIKKREAAKEISRALKQDISQV